MNGRGRVVTDFSFSSQWKVNEESSFSGEDRVIKMACSSRGSESRNFKFLMQCEGCTMTEFEAVHKPDSVFLAFFEVLNTKTKAISGADG